MLDYGFYNMDCMEGMRQFPDKYFDLAIVDPPYGGGSADYDAINQIFGERFNKYRISRTGGGWAGKYEDAIAAWDVAPDKAYFEELFRVSKNQIIWGANYFELPPTRCFVVWEKTNIPEKFTMAMCEYAWTSFNDNAKVYKRSSVRDASSGKFHPTEKPIDLYMWLLGNYAKAGDKILDTHVGSASSLIAFHKQHFDFVGFELNKDYYKKAKARLEAEQAQIDIYEAFGFNPYEG